MVWLVSMIGLGVCDISLLCTEGVHPIDHIEADQVNCGSPRLSVSSIDLLRPGREDRGPAVVYPDHATAVPAKDTQEVHTQRSPADTGAPLLHTRTMGRPPVKAAIACGRHAGVSS